MREDYLKELIKDVKSGAVSEEEAFEQLKVLPYMQRS